MQGPIENALMLAAAGNAFLGGKDIAGFWPNAPTFHFVKLFEFRDRPASGRDEDEYPLVAPDPMAWFQHYKGRARGFRLHHMAGERTEAQKQIKAPDRMLVGFVGGGPRWLVEVSLGQTSEMWEGFHRFGDRKEAKPWLCTNIMQGEVAAGDLKPVDLNDALSDLRTILPEIEAFAREEKLDNFAECFANASKALASPPAETPWLHDVARYAGFDQRQLSVLQAVGHAWVFGGMGSWNDTGGGPRYDELSERLFAALNDTICGLANSTFRG